MSKKTAIISGTPYLSLVGVNAFKDLGNTSKITVTHNVTKKTLPNYQGGGGNDDSFEKLESATIAASFRHVSIALLEMALGGSSVSVAAGAVADEPHTVVELDALIKLNHMQDMAQTLTVEPAVSGSAFVEGTDYIRKRSGIIPITGGAMTAAQAITVSYTKAKHLRVQALLSTSTEKAFMFDGINERTNKPWCYMYHRVNFGVAKSVELIGEDFISFEVEGEVLAYSGITDPAKSQFYEALIGDL